MDLKFKNNITSRVSTVNLERQLLHALMSDKINLQRSIGKHRNQFFTNMSRQFIYDCVRTYFDDKRSVLTKEQLDFEIQKRFDSAKDKSRIDDVTSEYDIIKSTAQTEGVDCIIDSLQEVQLANATDNLIRQAYSKLEAGQYQEAADLLRQKSIDLKEKQKQGRIINLHKDSDDWFEEVRNRKEHPEQYAGIPTGFEKFDKMTGGLFPAELTIVFGLSGKGKSTFMKALTCNIRKQGRVVLHCGNEENEFQIRSKYMSADSGEKYKPFKIGNYTDEEYNRLKIFSDNARGVGAIYIYEFPQQTDATWIERAYRYLEMQGVHVDVIVIDYLDLMKPIGKAYSENDEQGKITSDLKQIAINCHCPVITATQAGTQSEKQQKKEKPFLTAADVFGTKRKVHSANTLIGIVNQTATALANELDVKDRLKHRMVLCVPKNRDGAVFTFRQVMDVECGKFYEDTDDNDPVAKNLEKQANEMIDETVPPDQIRSEIDVKELQEAKSLYLNAQIKALEEQMNQSSSTEETSQDDFFEDAPKDDNLSSSSDIQETPNDDFFEDAPDYDAGNDDLNDVDEKQPDIQEKQEVTPEVPKNEIKEDIKEQVVEKKEETVRLSDSIPHKKPLSELLRKKK